MANPFLDKLNNTELMSAFGVTQDNAPLTPEQLATLSQQVPEPEIKQPVVKAAPAAPKQEQGVQPKNSDMQNAMNALENWQNRPKEASQSLDQSTAAAPDKPLSKLDQLEAMMKELQTTSSKDLEEARKSDRMLKIGGALGDALATYLNAQGQMNVKAPGVQVQQGAGLGKVADMFATAPEITSDVAAKREALMKQYGELAKGERAEKRLTSEEKLAKDRMAQQERLAEKENQAMLQAAGIRASGKGELTPYQEMMKEEKQIQKQEKDVKSLKEIETRKRTIEDNVERAKSIITKSGTFEMFGPESEELNSIIDEISVDMAKLQDPDSVARPNEVALVRKNLVPEGAMGKLGMSDTTAIKLLDKFKSRVDERAKNAYQVRGIKAPTGKEAVEPNQTEQKQSKKATVGDVVTVKGKKYKVAEDGDTLIPVGQ